MASTLEPTGQGGIAIAFRLPLENWKKAAFYSDFGYRGACLTVDGARVLEARTREELEDGVEGFLRGGEPIGMCLVEVDGVREVQVRVGGQPALREDRLRARPSRSAWTHAFLALGGSAAGFAASYFYLEKARRLGDVWAQKMGNHTAGWHLLLTLTLFPASVWGQRAGIRTVQLVSFTFFCIHAGMALANSDLGEPMIALFNAASGLLFLASTVYGNRAHRDMNPLRALSS